MNDSTQADFSYILDHALSLIISVHCDQQGHLAAGGGGSAFHASENLVAMAGTHAALPHAINSVQPTRPPAVSGACR